MAIVSADNPATPSREQRQAQQMLERIEQSLQETGLSRLIDNPQVESTADLTQLLENVDFTGVLSRKAVETGGEPVLVRDAELGVNVSPDGMTVEAAIIPPLGAGRPMEAIPLLSALKTAYNVVCGIDRVAVDRLIEAGRTQTTRAVIARGVLPVPGRVETWALIVADELGDADDRVDHRQHSARKAAIIGDLLARHLAAEPGQAGFNVHNEITPSPKLLKGRTLRAGPGTENREDGIYAKVSGEILCVGDVISVIVLRRIDGDVDFSTGNVEFPGSVFISGSVTDGFTVCVGGDVEVGGLIAGAHVEAKGSIRVSGGIVGRDKAILSAGGEITAKFIENARIESRGDVRVQRGILHSHVDTLGLVEVKGSPGAVVGGLLRTGTGLRCRTLGSVAGTHTRVVFGENHLVFRKLEAIDKAASYIRDRVSEVDLSLAPFKTLDAGNLRAESAPLLKKLIALRLNLLRNVQRLMTSRIAVRAEAENAPKGEVRVSEEVHVGVILSSRGKDRTVKEPYTHTRFRLSGEWIEVLPL